MPNWNEIGNEIDNFPTAHDAVRRKYLKALYDVTGRNVIIYYSGWLQKGRLGEFTHMNFGLQDEDKNGFMATIHQLAKSDGLDLILHTPGGDVAATESIVDYLRAVFGTDIRVFVPQLAMSGGTMIALSSQTIVMGKHSSLGPIDPQIGGGIAAQGILDEFEAARQEVIRNPAALAVWRPIIEKYSPSLIGDCMHAVAWCKQMAKKWLVSGMFKGETDADAKADRIIQELADHGTTKSHSRHYSLQGAIDLGLNVLTLESDKALQDAVLPVHHAAIHTLTNTPACKIIENHAGTAYIERA